MQFDQLKTARVHHAARRRGGGVAACGAGAAAGDAGDWLARRRFSRAVGGAHGRISPGPLETGYVEGRNVAIEYRWAEGQFDRLPALAADLVSRKATVIFASLDVGVQAAMAATKTIPIVFTTASDPVAAGFVSSLARPVGNVTGITFVSVELIAKRLELLHELLPGAIRIAVLVNPEQSGHHAECHRALAGRRAPPRAGDRRPHSRHRKRDRKLGFASAVQQQAAALSIGTDAYLTSRSRQIAFFALRHALPTSGDYARERRRRHVDELWQQSGG